MEPTVEKVIRTVDDDRQALIDLCLQLGNLVDFAGHERPVAEAVVAWLQAAGFSTVLQPISLESANAVGVLAGSGDRSAGGKNLILNAHMDTEGNVPAGGPEVAGRLRGAWHEDDVLFGKSIANDKAQLAAQMIAARAIKKAGVKLKGDLIVTGVAQETGARVDLQQSARPDPMVGPHVGEGFGSRWLIDHGIVADYALIGEGEAGDFAMDTAQCGYLRLRIAVRGRVPYTPFVARGERVQDNPNPHEKAAHVVVALENWSREYQRREQLEYWGGTIIPTAQVQELRASGPLFTDAVECCYIYFDIRIIPGRNPVDLQDEISTLVDALGFDCETIPYDYNRGYIATGADALIDAVKDAHQQVTGKELGPPTPPFVSMWRDMNAFNEVGIPSISYGPPNRPEPYTVGGYSSVLVDDLLTAAKVYALVALTICETVE